MRWTVSARAIGFLTGAVLLLGPRITQAQDLAKRLILKDGSYQSVSKYEMKGDRVRYLSAERGEWEELPKSMVDPGLQLPEEGGVFLLDTYQNKPELVPIDQRGGSVNKNTKGNILRAAVNPVASARQTVEVPGKHAPVQSHVGVPALYINIDRGEEQPVAETPPAPSTKEAGPPPPAERFRIIRLETKGDKRVVGDIKIAVYGKISQDAKFVASTAQPLTGGWVKVTPTESLLNGEYAVVEMLGKEGMNLYVWDFGVNPNASPNAVAFKPDPSGGRSNSDKAIELQKREKQK